MGEGTGGKLYIHKKTRRTLKKETEKDGGRDLRRTLGLTLRWGVTVACAIALTGGAVYLLRHGNEPVSDYSVFDASHPSYTTLEGIFGGFFNFEAWGVIQVGVIALLLTPVMRVVLSLIDFSRRHDWLYAFISAVVLAIIFVNSISSPV